MHICVHRSRLRQAYCKAPRPQRSLVTYVFCLSANVISSSCPSFCYHVLKSWTCVMICVGRKALFTACFELIQMHANVSVSRAQCLCSPLRLKMSAVQCFWVCMCLLFLPVSACAVYVRAYLSLSVGVKCQWGGSIQLPMHVTGSDHSNICRCTYMMHA